jgi:mono/diheme cytochrome c family protein
MNRQINYIFSAIGILVAGFGVLFILKIIFTSTVESESSNYIDEEKSTVSYTLSDKAVKGQDIFMRKCASCHALLKNMTGPSLKSAISNEQWSDRKKLYAWIRDPVSFMKNDAYTQRLKKEYGSMMAAFPTITDEEIEAIVEFIKSSELPGAIPMAYAN